MVFKMKHNWSLLTALLLAVISIYSCSPDEFGFTPTPSPGRTETEPSIRVPAPEYKNVFIFYLMGYNNLTYFMQTNIRDILRNPISNNQRDVVLILSHFIKKDYYTPTNPTLTKVSQNIDGSIQKDTLLILPDNKIASSAEVLNEVLTYIHDNFEAERYGMLMSSHGSGWVPEGYLTKAPTLEYNYKLENNKAIPIALSRQMMEVKPIPEPQRIHLPLVKSIGGHYPVSSSIEIEIPDLAKAIPFKLDYLIFDACLMGGIEVAYELRNVTNKIVSSQTEILADGMHYPSLCSNLFAKEGPDLVGICENYYKLYEQQSGTYRSCTISLLDCSKLDVLAQVTQNILAQHRNELNNVQDNRDHIQKYYRPRNDSTLDYYESHQQWYYDFKDIITNFSLSEEEYSAFESALADVVLYKAATEKFMNELVIKRHSGLSMYLPFTTDRDYLNNFYKTLEWNKATGLIQ